MASEENILAVDDEASIRRVISRTLVREGFNCLVAEGYDQALDILRNNEIALVLSDIRMPGKTGIDLLQDVQRLYPGTKVIMVTGVEDAATAIDCMRQGAVNYLTKPFDTVKLIAGVREALELRLKEAAKKKQYQRLENEVKRRIDEIRQASAELKKLDKKKHDFMASVSHELLTPLNVIIGFSEILANDEVDSQTQQELTTSIYEQGKQLEKMLQEILTVAQCDSQIQLKQQRLDIAELLEAVLSSVERRGDNRQYSKSFEAGACTVTGDEMWLSQVLFNLLDNAVKFTAENGLIEVSCRDTDSGVLIQVKDNGVGISPEELNYIFEDFFQVGDSLVGKNPGLGLGLSLSRRIVELHNGKIWAESEGEGKGSVFNIILPAETG